MPDLSPRIGAFAESSDGALTILRDQPSIGYMILSYQEYDADDSMTLTLPMTLFAAALSLFMAPNEGQATTKRPAALSNGPKRTAP